MKSRPFWLLLGLSALACAGAGVVLPLVPTTPFVLLAAYAFARSSPRLHGWLLSHARFGPLIDDWSRHGCIARDAKIAAMVAIALALGITLAVKPPLWVIGAQAGVLFAAGLFIVTRPSRREQ
jgi:uncharacterized membrane protein YbaN (DUF454 family)